jgi:hypothetical protein
MHWEPSTAQIWPVGQVPPGKGGVGWVGTPVREEPGRAEQMLLALSMPEGIALRNSKQISEACSQERCSTVRQYTHCNSEGKTLALTVQHAATQVVLGAARHGAFGLGLAPRVGGHALQTIIEAALACGALATDDGACLESTACVRGWTVHLRAWGERCCCAATYKQAGQT